MKQSGYRRSYILRYLEEALAETYAQLKMYGLGKEHFIKGIKFPLGAKYEISIVKMGEEAKGILVGPITIAGMVFEVYEGERTEMYEQTAEQSL